MDLSTCGPAQSNHSTECFRILCQESPDKSTSVQLFQCGFVDDVMNWKNATWGSVDPTENLKELIEQASRDSQLWHDILAAGNQALELPKCKYHVMHYTFEDTGDPILATDKTPPFPLQVHDDKGGLVEIEYVPSDQALKYLGFKKCIANQKDQKEAIKTTADGYARIVNTSSLNRHSTETFYRGTYEPSVGYVLPLCYFSQDELSQIQKKAHVALLNGCGYNRCTSTAIVYGPKDLGGAGFFHLLDLQGFGQVQIFMKYWRTPDSHQGKTLRIVMEWVQYCVVTSYSIFQDTGTSRLHHLEAKWIASLRDYLHEINATFDFHDDCVPPPQRQNDTYIMEHVLQSKRFKPSEIRRINFCRLWLRVITVADIANAAGTCIAIDKLEWDNASPNANSKWHHVHQKKPNKETWRLWHKVCQLFSTPSTNHATSHGTWKLHRPLGDWIVPLDELRKQWKYFQEPNSNCLYQLCDSKTITMHQSVNTGMLFGTNYDIHPTSTLSSLPVNAAPVDTHTYDTTIAVIANYNIRWDLPAPPPAPSSRATSWNFAPANQHGTSNYSQT